MNFQKDAPMESKYKPHCGEMVEYYKPICDQIQIDAAHVEPPTPYPKEIRLSGCCKKPVYHNGTRFVCECCGNKCKTFIIRTK